MSKVYLGVDIGAESLHLVLCDKSGGVRCLPTDPMPKNLVRDGRVVSVEAMAQVLRAALKGQKGSAKNCALVLPPELAFTRRISMPYMTTEQLTLNLPYEFRDYIQKDKDMFFYDYAVLSVQTDEAGTPKAMELLAAAVSKEIIAEYRHLLSKAGLRLALALPEGFALRNLIRDYQLRNPGLHPTEYCIVDLGHTATRAHMFRGSAYDTTRAIEYGGAALDALIADHMDVDAHVAASYKRANYEGVQELPSCRDLYTHIAVEILRALNFYSYNNPDSNLEDVYFCGGLTRIPTLMQVIRQTLPELRLHDIRDLMPPLSEEENAERCPAAVGAALQ